MSALCHQHQVLLSHLQCLEKERERVSESEKEREENERGERGERENRRQGALHVLSVSEH